MPEATKISELARETPIHRTPPVEREPSVDESDELEKLASKDLSQELPPADYTGFNPSDKKRFGEVLLANNGDNEVNNFRKEISEILGRPNSEEKRRDLLAIDTKIAGRLSQIADEINLAKTMGTVPQDELDTLYGDLVFLRQEFLQANLPAIETTTPQTEVEKWKSNEGTLPESIKVFVTLGKNIRLLSQKDPLQLAKAAAQTEQQFLKQKELALKRAKEQGQLRAESSDQIDQRQAEEAYLQSLIEGFNAIPDELFTVWKSSLDRLHPELHALSVVAQSTLDLKNWVIGKTASQVDLLLTDIVKNETALQTTEISGAYKDFPRYLKFIEDVLVKVGDKRKFLEVSKEQLIKQKDASTLIGKLRDTAWYQKGESIGASVELPSSATEKDLQAGIDEISPSLENLMRLFESIRDESGLFNEQRKLMELLQKRSDAYKKRLLSLRSGEHLDQNTRETREWIRSFFDEREVPQRKENESFEDYLRTLHINFIRLARGTVWNKQNDQSTAPHTADYHSDALRGPANFLKLNSYQQVYKGSHDNRVKDFGSLFDQLKHYFDDPREKAQAADFAERMKAIFGQISVLHNRSVVFAKNHDATGPDGSLKAYGEIAGSSADYGLNIQYFFDREHMTEQERFFSEAVEFSMAVWSAQLLEADELVRLRPHMSDSVRKFSDPEHPKFNPDFFAAPWYTSDQGKRERLVEAMIKEMQQTLVKKEVDRLRAKGEIADTNRIAKLTEEYRAVAELAYHTGESFRIGCGLNPFMDVTFQKSANGESFAKVIAKEGAPKAALIGLYVDSAIHTEVRPDFNLVFAQQMAKGYAPFARTLQFTQNTGFDISGFGDNRASLLEILAVEGAVETVDWRSGATNADQIVLDAANQTINHIWPRASISKSVKPENSFFVEVTNIPLGTTMLLDREDELNQLRNTFGYSGEFVRNMSNFARKVPFINPNFISYEVNGFDSDSAPITGQRLQHIKTMYKDVRDYWINAFKPDQDRFPMDTIRLMKFIFSRKDKANGYVNPKIESIIEGARSEMKGQLIDVQRDYLKKKFIPQIQGYLNFDLLMRSVFYMLAPDFRTIDAREHLFDEQGNTIPEGIKEVYNDLDFGNFEELEVQNRGGARIVNVAQLEFVINQSMVLRDLFEGEELSIKGSGYHLFNNTDYSKYTDDKKVLGNPDLKNELYTRSDMLRIAQEFGLGEGYIYRKVEDRQKRHHWQLQRYGKEVTLQYLSDRILLTMFLFHKDAVKINSGKH